jgi:hypothetical protein
MLSVVLEQTAIDLEVSTLLVHADFPGDSLVNVFDFFLLPWVVGMVENPISMLP